MTVDIVDFAPEVKAPPYVDDVRAVYESGAHGALTVATEDVAKVKRQVLASARHVGLSARFVHAEPAEGLEDEMRLIFRVGEKITRKPRKTAEDTAPASAE